MISKLSYSSFSILIILFTLGAVEAQQLPAGDLSQIIAGLEKYKWKLSPPLAEGWFKHEATEKERILIMTKDRAAFRERLRASNLYEQILLEYPETGVFLLWLSPEEVCHHILPLEEVVFIDRRNRMPQEERAVRGFDLSVNAVNVLHARYPKYRGAGQVVSVKEFRFDSTDIDLSGRVIPSSLASETQSSHATTMASMIAGGGNTFYTGKGVAWGASLSSSSFLNVFPDELVYFESSGIGVQNHSYGLGIENYYGAEALAYDQQVDQRPSLLHVFSAGNMGDSTSRSGMYAGVEGFANLSGNFKMAKNVLVVGSVDSLSQVASRSSRGPAYDGRIKPDLVAFGEDGSSGAAAVTSGLAALLQGAYAELNGDIPASAALLRAVLINSADDIGMPGPDYIAGYGNIKAPKALEAILDNRFVVGRLMSGNIESIFIQVPDNALNLKVALAWADPPAVINTASALVNDLDLVLKQADERWLPWTLSTFPHPDSLKRPAVRRADNLNNQEQITIAFPTGGTYEIEVRADNLLEETQEFFVTWQWDTVGHFQWIFPTASDNVLAGRRTALRWESTAAGPAAVLEYRLAGDEEWTVITNDIALGGSLFFWEVPDTLSLAQLRMIIGGRVLLSDTFSISTPPEMELGFECADSLLLYWPKQSTTDSFQVFSLNGPYLQPLATVQDTFIVVGKAQNPTRFYAVAPFIGGTPTLGERSFALNLDFQPAGCYIQNFLAGLIGEEVKLELILGTSYQVDSMIFEKERNGRFTPLSAFGSKGELRAEWVDRALREGLNTYRAVVVRFTGDRVYSEPVSVLFTRKPYLLYPNPVSIGQEVNLLSKDIQGARFFLYNALGRLLLEFPLASGFESIPTKQLPGGVYYYQILVKRERREEGQLLIR